MGTSAETAAIVALLQTGRRRPADYPLLIERTGSARAVLEQELGLLTDRSIEDAEALITSWRRQRIGLLTMLDPGYPANLAAVPDRPLLLFVLGRLLPTDIRSVAVIGSRRATPAGEAMAREVARGLVEAGYVVTSGLAAGIDTAAHTEALSRGGRSLAVIGTGVRHCYPAQNAELQRRIGEHGAVVSQLWPDTPPRRGNFPLRNAVMAGISLATVVVEASARSGARIQARISLDQGRPVILTESVLEQPWARELSRRPGVFAAQSASEVPVLVSRHCAGSLVA